ncbi:hypothetical protein AQJ67_44170 [Streptomyces caeruleatus]|uniref:Uncharacterized protein n=1 Tax=Streptomyces caeruleatus TaxID=661399 RepID=A0A101TDK5_9ACTN|nr:hypothetical protein AQJ67_44170 [Streptomyces caeruleatus]
MILVHADARERVHAPVHCLFSASIWVRFYRIVSDGMRRMETAADACDTGYDCHLLVIVELSKIIPEDFVEPRLGDMSVVPGFGHYAIQGTVRGPAMGIFEYWPEIDLGDVVCRPQSGLRAFERHSFMEVIGSLPFAEGRGASNLFGVESFWCVGVIGLCARGVFGRAAIRSGGRGRCLPTGLSIAVCRGRTLRHRLPVGVQRNREDPVVPAVQRL